MSAIQQGTTYVQNFIVVSSTDHVSPLLGGSPVVTLSKGGSAFAPAAGTVSEISSGWYSITLTPVDTNTVGDLSFHITTVGGDNTDFNAQVLATITPPSPPPPPPAPGGNFSASNVGLAVSAYSRIGIRRTSLLAEHMADAFNEFGLMQSMLNNLQPNLWTVDLVTLPLVAGTSTYSVDPTTIMILDMYLNVTGSPDNTDRLMSPISRTEYASFPNKTQQGSPTVFWFDRNIVQTVTLWEIPDGNSPSVQYYRCVQLGDANFANGQKPNIPNRLLDCFTAELAYRLSRIWAPALEDKRKMDAAEAWKVAATQDVENTTGFFVMPALNRYYGYGP